MASPTCTAIVLLSGGLDSATVLAWACRQGHRCLALSFAYGQRHAWELAKARQLAEIYALSHKVLKLDSAIFRSSLVQETQPKEAGQVFDTSPKKQRSAIPPTYVPARNILFLSHALALAESYAIGHIFLGINALDYSGYPDCRPEFLEAFRSMASLGMRCGVEGEPVQIHAPLLHLSKKDIIRKGLSLGVDYALTSSCYQPQAKGRPCGKCESCSLRKQGFREAAIQDPLFAAMEKPHAATPASLSD